MKYIYQIFIMLLIISITACGTIDSNLIAGNDEDQDVGIGGTGLWANTDNGIGGTGITGIITGYGSIFVNGIEIEYNNKTPFTINGESKIHQQLEIGDVVEILTTDANQHTHARIINLRHEVIGKVESVNPKTSSFNVLGQTIIQNIDAELPDIGTRVTVSGIRINTKTIQASKVRATKSHQTLLRTKTELPFIQEAKRWLIQKQVKNNKVTFDVNGLPRVVSLKDTTKQSSIKIIELHKSSSGEIILDRTVKSKNLQQGKKIFRQDKKLFRKNIPMRMNSMQRRFKMGL